MSDYTPKGDLMTKLAASLKTVKPPKKEPRELVLDALHLLDAAVFEMERAAEALPEESWTRGELEGAAVACKRLFIGIGSIARKELKP